MVAINIKLAPERDYEMKIARVVGNKLPWGYKKRFFISLCRSVISPEMSDDEARDRVIKIVEEGLQAISGFGAQTIRENALDEVPTSACQETVPEEAAPSPEAVSVETPSALERPPMMGSMFRVG